MRAQAKITTAAEAVSHIPAGATVAIGGFVGAAHPEALTVELEKRFLAEGAPQGLTLIYAAGQGDGKERGLNHLAYEGLVKRVIGGHWNLAPKLGKLALENRIEAYNFPQGVLSVLFREIAAKRPGIFTKVGMDSFIDPKNGGGKLNTLTTEDLVERIELGGEEWLWYHSVPVHVGLIRGTRADRQGNISFEREGIVGEVLPIAQAAKNHGGIVIVQVEEVVDCISDPKSVRVPGLLVDYIVVSKPEQHQQTFAEQFNPGYVEHTATPAFGKDLEFSERIIIGRRALKEINKGDIVNLGIGLPEMVAAAARTAGTFGDFTLTVESGPVGGVPASGLSFGCSLAPEAIVDQPSQFDFYDGGGLDIAALGAVEIDEQGNVCVSCFGQRFAGVGGFLNICRSARRLVFCSTFRASGLSIAFEDEKLKIVEEGKHCKFVPAVREICFHGPSAVEQGQEVLYVTERAVFRLTPGGLQLEEVAPGITVEEILAGMSFKPLVGDVKTMPLDCFTV